MFHVAGGHHDTERLPGRGNHYEGNETS